MANSATVRNYAVPASASLRLGRTVTAAATALALALWSSVDRDQLPNSNPALHTLFEY